jgi:GNAT superfamily N-acetyltransferase
MKKIEINIDKSNIFGNILTIDSYEFYEYFSAFFDDKIFLDIKSWLKLSDINEFALIRNVFVDEDNRNKGVGKKLVSDFIGQTNNLPILLLAGADEEDFNLTDWYIKLGFTLTKFSCTDGPIMIKL